MASASNYLETALLNHVLRNVPYTSPSTVYVGLYTSNPTDAGTGTEVSGGSYARQPATFDAPSNGKVINSAEIRFPVATGYWGTITHFGIHDAQSGGNLLVHGPVTNPKEIDVDDEFVFRQGKLEVEID